MCICVDLCQVFQILSLPFEIDLISRFLQRVLLVWMEKKHRKIGRSWLLSAGIGHKVGESKLQLRTGSPCLSVSDKTLTKIVWSVEFKRHSGSWSLSSVHWPHSVSVVFLRWVGYFDQVVGYLICRFRLLLWTLLCIALCGMFDCLETVLCSGMC